MCLFYDNASGIDRRADIFIHAQILLNGEVGDMVS